MALYKVQNQWGGDAAPWHDGGIFVLGCRSNQNVVQLKAATSKGDDMSGEMTYSGEGPIGLKLGQLVGNSYSAENQWGGTSAPWHDGGKFLIGCRDNQRVVAIDISSPNGGQNLEGTMTYAGEGPIGFKAEIIQGSAYYTENQWGGNSAPWHPGGVLVLGTRQGQKPVGYDISSSDGGDNFGGDMNYAGEGPIGFKGASTDVWANYTVENQWGGNQAPWHPAGTFVLSARDGQKGIALKCTSSDGGATLSGEYTYDGEGPIGFKGSFLP